MTNWGDGEALDVEVDKDYDLQVELGHFLNNCRGVRNSMPRFNENCPRVVSNILDVDLIGLPLTPSENSCTQFLILSHSCLLYFLIVALHSLAFTIGCFAYGCKMRTRLLMRMFDYSVSSMVSSQT